MLLALFLGMGVVATALIASRTLAEAVQDKQTVTPEGAELVSADYAGQDVILWFWAPW